jgi:hypothetical protein
MRVLRRLFHRTFWYELALKTTLRSTLRRSGRFSEFEIDSLLARSKRLERESRHLLVDLQSEYHISWCAVIQAVYEAYLGKGQIEEAAIEATKAVIFENLNAAMLAKRVERTLDRSRDPFATMTRLSKDQEKRFFGDGFRFDRIADDESSYRVEVRRCLYCDYFRENGLPELMRVACAWDLASWSLGVAPERHRMRFERPITLGLDGEDCDFRFYRT